MKKGKDIAAKFIGLSVVHQNIPGKELTAQFDQHLLFIPLQGEISVQVKDITASIGLGQMLYLPPKTLHSFSSSDHLGERLIAMIDAKKFRSPLAIQPVKVPLSQFIKELLFYLLLHPESPSAKALIAVFVETLKESLAQNGVDKRNLDHLAGKVFDSRLKAALDFMGENLTEPLSMEAVAKIAGLSGRNFNRLLVKETGLQPRQWLIQFRIDKAQELLKVPGTSVTDVAYAIGYNSLSQFISAFRTRTGLLPSEFSRRH